MSTSPSPAPLAAIILAAGQGKRMQSALHKTLHPIAHKPMLLHILDSLAPLSPVHQIVVVGAGRSQVEAALKGRPVRLAHQAEQLGTGHAARQAEAALQGFQGTVLILAGDVPLITTETLQKLAAALTPDTAAAVLGFRPSDPAHYGRILTTSDRITKMVEYKDATPEERATPLCNSGLMAVRAADLWPRLARLTNTNKAQEYYLPDVITQIIADGLTARLIEAPASEVLGANSRAELATIEAAFQARARTALMAAGVAMPAPETVFLAHDTTAEPDALIEPFTVFGPGVHIGRAARIRAHSHIEGAHIGEGCEVGPFARLRPGTVLEQGVKIGNFVETKNARFAPGAKANHLSYLGDAHIGEAANIGAGTITCNYDGFAKHQTIIGTGAFIGSNTALVAPVTIGERAIIGAGSTITSDVAPDALALTRAPQQAKPGWAARFRALMSKRPK
ncbi:MAG: bifunctional UDP-N-acetylglucosamine diphosphorylase/glucosamine-1-phosphate N-acetyltransferase GlmU [Polymorphobacter sp.]|uniref:bifunctional UDP-N-acetylglucosamine diphosphorylase/glucosamine-1-phosphate N-acetyltransferase GlmU n=1 Tax=Polymorphobacter sp. TaxID=1909290 RepID=UPI003A86C961